MAGNMGSRSLLIFAILAAAIAVALAGIRTPGDRSDVALAGQDGDGAKPTARGAEDPEQIKAREATMRADNNKNLKQLSLGLLNYANLKKHLPGPAIRSKDGKPLLSWRVAILPYLDKKELYQAFHLDEPWDSEHNKKLLWQMPAVYRHPNDDPNSTNASYFMPVGKGTIGENPDGCPLADVRDGASKTIMIVSTKRSIPWTKPEDIEIDFDPSKRLPKFGGNMGGGVFSAAFVDGHVNGISEAIDERLLSALLTIAGGEDPDDIDLSNPEQPNNIRPKGEKQK
jgi:uncharacterized protein DUF1559